MYTKETALRIEATILGAIMCISIVRAVYHLFNG